MEIELLSAVLIRRRVEIDVEPEIPGDVEADESGERPIVEVDDLANAAEVLDAISEAVVDDTQQIALQSLSFSDKLRRVCDSPVTVEWTPMLGEVEPTEI